MTKIVIFKTLKRHFSGTTQLITILNTVLKSIERALFFDSSLSAKFKISKSRNLIGRKFSNFFIGILLKYIGYLRFSLERMISEISLT